MKSTVYPRLALAVAGVLSAATAAAAAPGDTGKLEDVVVTAQRRSESAQDIGVALTVLSATDLAAAGVDRVNGLQNVTPSLEVEPAFGSGQPQFRLRGVGFIDYTSNNTSAVGVTVGDVPLPFPIQTQGALFDIERVEVLRGPQGTLYGRNTTAGAVNFVINRPTQENHGGIDLSHGSHDAFAAEGYVSGPLADGVRGRLSFATEQGGAWQRNRATGEALGDKNKFALRGQLEWDVTKAVNLRLTLHASTDKSDAYGTQLIAPVTPAAPGAAVIPADTSPYATGWSLSPTFAGVVGISARSKPGVDNSDAGGDLTLTADLDGVRVTSITAYDQFTRRELGDWDGTQYVESDIYFHDNVKVFSQELRVASTGTGPLGWVGGAYYSDEKLHENFYGDFSQRLGGAALTEYGQHGQSLGIFGQGNYRFTDRLKGILGLRYEHEKRDLEGLSTLFAVGNPPDFTDIASASNPGGLTFNLNGGPQNRTLSSSDVSGKLGLEFKLDTHALLYATISRGVKSGGFTAHNTTTPNPTILDSFKPEKLTAYEVGAKVDLGGALRLDASLFHYDYRDQQVLSKYFDTTSQSYVGLFINAPKSKIDGGEVELTWAPGGGFELSQFVGYKQGKFTDKVLSSSNNPDEVGANFNGKDIDFPKLSYGGSLAYTVPVGALQLRGEVNYSYHDNYDQVFLLEVVDPATATLSGAPQFKVDSYWLANASIELAPAEGGAWSVALWGHNITNQKYFATKNFFLPWTHIGAAGEPTTFGIRVKYSF